MALRGVKVIELAGLAPVPFCGMVLADFGATVIRVDQPNSNINLDVLTNGKKTVSINLKHPNGKKIFKSLCKESDVLIEPYRKGVMEKLALGPNILLQENPKLIYARLTGYGQKGYYSDRAGHDINYLSISGLLSLFARKGQKPTPPINLAADFGGGGLMCAFGIVAALFERTKSGKGQIIDANMVQGVSYLGSWLYRAQQLPIFGNPPGENILDSGAHFYETYKTKDDKYMAVGALEPKFYAELIDKLNLDPNEFDQYSDFERKKDVLSKIFLQKTQKEWCQIFDSTDACVTPVLNLEDAKNHIHNTESNTFQIQDNETICPNPAPTLNRTPATSVAMSKRPESAQHTYEILKSLKYTNAEISQFEKEGVIEILKKSKL